MAEPALIPMDSLDKLLRDLQAYQLTEATMLEAAMHAQHRELMVNIAIRAELALQEAEVAWVLMMMGDL
jgi:hypothetical protein